jgi:hypothetical protein
MRQVMSVIGLVAAALLTIWLLDFVAWLFRL